MDVICGDFTLNFDINVDIVNENQMLFDHCY